MKDNEKIKIVGASGAGLWTAINLRKNGIPVEVYEVKNRFKPVSRVLIVTSDFLRFIPELPDTLILNRIDVFEVISRGSSSRFKLLKPDLVINRKHFINWLYNKAIQTGVSINLGKKLKSIYKENGSWIAEFENPEIKQNESVVVENLIGADGALSETRKSLNIFLPYVHLLQAKVPLPKSFPINRVRIWFDKKKTRFFYWLIPYSKNYGVLGLIDEDKSRIKNKLDHFLRDINLEPISFQSGVVSMYTPSHPFETKMDGLNVFFVGDAGAQVKVTTVGGTVSGLWGANALTRSLLTGKDYTKISMPLKRELDSHFYIRKVLNVMSNSEYDTMLRRASVRLKHILEHYPRDRLAKFMFSLFIKDPYFLYLGFKKFNKLLSPHF